MKNFHKFLFFLIFLQILACGFNKDSRDTNSSTSDIYNGLENPDRAKIDLKLSTDSLIGQINMYRKFIEDVANESGLSSKRDIINAKTLSELERHYRRAIERIKENVDAISDQYKSLTYSDAVSKNSGTINGAYSSIGNAESIAKSVIEAEYTKKKELLEPIFGGLTVAQQTQIERITGKNPYFYEKLIRLPCLKNLDEMALFRLSELEKELCDAFLSSPMLAELGDTTNGKMDTLINFNSDSLERIGVFLKSPILKDLNKDQIRNLAFFHNLTDNNKLKELLNCPKIAELPSDFMGNGLTPDRVSLLFATPSLNLLNKKNVSYALLFIGDDSRLKRLLESQNFNELTVDEIKDFK